MDGVGEMAQDIKPCADWVLAVSKSEERVSAGGLVLPATTMADDEGDVIAVGPDVKRCKVGDRIVFGRCRSKRDIQGVHRYLIQDADVLALIE